MAALICEQGSRIPTLKRSPRTIRSLPQKRLPSALSQSFLITFLAQFAAMRAEGPSAAALAAVKPLRAAQLKRADTQKPAVIGATFHGSHKKNSPVKIARYSSCHVANTDGQDISADHQRTCTSSVAVTPEGISLDREPPNTSSEPRAVASEHPLPSLWAGPVVARLSLDARWSPAVLPGLTGIRPLMCTLGNSLERSAELWSDVACKVAARVYAAVCSWTWKGAGRQNGPATSSAQGTEDLV
eukprot:m51a1_g1767 hypothetical protein (243) ;mRNA; r:309396-310650